MEKVVLVSTAEGCHRHKEETITPVYNQLWLPPSDIFCFMGETEQLNKLLAVIPPPPLPRRVCCLSVGVRGECADKATFVGCDSKRTDNPATFLTVREPFAIIETHIHARTHTHTHTRARARAHTHAHKHTRARAHTYARTRTHAHT